MQLKQPASGQEQRSLFEHAAVSCYIYALSQSRAQMFEMMMHLVLPRVPSEMEHGPPGLSGTSQGTSQAPDAQTPRHALQQPDTNTQELRLVLVEKETQLAAALQRAEQLSVELTTANRLAEDRQRLLREEVSSSSTRTKQSLQLEQQLATKQASLEVLQKQLDNNSKAQATQLQELQGRHKSTVAAHLKSLTQTSILLM